jgi:type I restriction enzyme S subunit
MAAKPRFDGEWVRLGELCNICSGGTPKRSVAEYWNDGAIPWVKISDISSKYVAETEECITEAGLNGSSAKMLDPGTLLYSIFASIGAVGILEMPAATNQAIAALSIKAESVDRDYLYHFLKSREALAKSTGRGAAQNNINLTILREMMVPVPSAVVQELIVEQLETVLNQIESAKAQLESLDALVKSRFAEMFGDFKTNPYSWDVYSFNQFASIDTHMTKDYASFADAPHVGIDSIESCTGELIGYRTVREDNVRSGKYVFGPDHIIYSKIRPALNKVALPDFEGVCSADAYPILPNKSLCNRVFLAYVMRSDYFLEYILPLSGRAQMPKVNKKALMGFSMPLPPLTLQQEFADFAAEVDKSRFIVQQQIEKLQMLYDSLAQEYFS